jgi:uncharacterized protein
MHHRFAPKAHRFDYRIFLFALDLDELAHCESKLRLFSVNHRNLYSFREHDFFPVGESVHNASPATSAVIKNPNVTDRSLKAQIIARLADTGIDLTGGRVLLVTLPRVFGCLFNPVSFYFCFDRDGQPAAAIAEVTNTFREMKPYILGPDTCRPGERGATFSLRLPKYFYVSPFTDTDVAFDFTLRTPGDQLSIQIDDYDATQRTLTSVLSGSRRTLTDARLAWYTFKYPFITLKVIALIHWHAFKLYLKKVPWFAKAARPEAQRDLYRPHISIATPPKA